MDVQMEILSALKNDIKESGGGVSSVLIHRREASAVFIRAASTKEIFFLKLLTASFWGLFSKTEEKNKLPLTLFLKSFNTCPFFLYLKHAHFNIRWHQTHSLWL